MENNKRISPEEVVSSFVRTGLMAKRHRIYDVYTNTNCACGIGAIYADKNNLGRDEILAIAEDSEKDKEVYESLDDIYGNEYVNGFVNGFDNGHTPPYTRSKRYKDGYKDGASAWEAVVEKDLVYK